MTMQTFETIQNHPAVITQTTTSILYQLQWSGPKLPSLWINDQINRSAAVQRYRNYEQGDHDLMMSAEMMSLLGIRTSTYSPFADNYQSIIVQTLVDRCKLQTVQATNNDEGSQWCADVWEYVRMDALSGDVHEATARDGDCFVMVTWDDAAQQLRFTLEEAYDGTQGMLAFYRSKVVPVMDCAIKIWQIALDLSLNVLTRVNIYWPDHVEKYYAINQAPLEPWQGGDISVPEYNPKQQSQAVRMIKGGNGRKPGSAYKSVDVVSKPMPSTVIHFEPEQWSQPYVTRDGQPLGIPIIHFRNRGRQNYGRSEIKNSIPLQDALNRIMYSLVINAEYNGFPLRWAKGFPMQPGLRPGSIINMSDAPLSKDEVVDVGQLPAADMSPFIKTLTWITSEMGKITRTPTPEFSGEGGRLSGEALKQLDIGLIGKANRAMVKWGNAWEDVFMMGYRIQEAYGDKLPPAGVQSFKSVWASPEIRNDQEVVQNVMQALPITGKLAALRAMSSVFDWTEDDIQKMYAEQQQETIANLAALSSVPTFSHFNQPSDVSQVSEPQPTGGEAETVQPVSNQDLSGQTEGEQQRTAE